VSYENHEKSPPNPLKEPYENQDESPLTSKGRALQNS